MEIPVAGGFVEGLRAPGLPARLAVLQRHRRRRQVRAWGTRVAVLTACVWVAMFVVVALVH